MRHGMSVIPQTYRFSGTFPSMSVQDNLTMLSMRKTGRFGIINRRLTRFSAADFAAEYEKHMLQGSSQWNTFNLLLFRQLAGGIRVMILEDPLADLDIIARDHLLQILHFFNRQGMAIIILCSDDDHIDTYLAFCSRVLPLNGT